MQQDIQTQIEAPIETVIQKLESWYDALINLIPNMAVTLLLLIIFLVLARLGSKLSIKLFYKASKNEAFGHLFSTVVYAAILGLGFFIMLGVLGLNKALTSLIAGIGVLGLVLGFAFQDIAADFISGIILAFRKPFKVGDIIGIKDIMGVVSKIDLRVTIIETFQGQEVYIPNKDILQSAIYNYSILKKRRIDIAVGVSYAEDLDKVEDVVLSTIKNLEGVIDHDKIVFDYSDFDSSSINFNIRFWIEYPGEPSYFTMKNKAIKAIKSAFDKQDITIPFPIRTLDFGIKGGQKLSQMELDINGVSKEKSTE
ncbi:mechanosensitive ion channel-like protein [Algoriphagus ratkowskyi]|uniref:Mechanosensitive ion channel family protein n=1 Tax=Algoriphagus ratkowskyi TaxID=57028 RepID=A0A2W7R862_9BACT|nr:mechanosensitive ion channel domain-containing protein [Algoriphagus ratkowskyi]PZX57048.1 mechanosensitive ion channel-like protein [Algoriphagus ratkowskyi]TXD79945.1 mechanosensitive ion channel family protein [Algoriphagus ratkowskyi]